MTFKSRFAPSPSGLLHVGNARSAVLNWANIKNKGGDFILRIDDTDSERSKKEYENQIKNDLNWLGIHWDKTFNQSERFNLYQKNIDFLKRKKRLYPCFETTEELNLKRKSLLSAGKPPIYDRSSLRLTQEQIQNKINNGAKPHWRFKIENKKIEWVDLIKGKVTFESDKLSDPILIREDSSLLYHLPSVIDDIEENITDIIRGEDHINNTAFHIQIFEALNSTLPSFGHHPLLTDQYGKSFSKRTGSLSIKKLKEIGFENITLLNYLLTIGTSQNLSKEKNIKNLFNIFKIDNLAKSSAKFSLKVLEDLNKSILQSYEFSEIKEKFSNHLKNSIDENFWLFSRNNINYFSDISNWLDIVKSELIYPTEDQDYLNIAAELLPEEPFDIMTWDKWTSNIKSKTGRNGKDLYMPIRIALTGKNKGPELKFLIPLLSRKDILKRLGL